jgi:hypothetical protein
MRLFAIPRRPLFLGAALLTLVALQGCSDDDDDNPMDPGGQSTELSGIYVSHYDGGKMTVTIPLASAALAPRLGGSALAHDVAVTGLLSPDLGETVDLTGTYNEETDSLYATGTNPGFSSPYLMWGKYEPVGSVPGIAGHYQGPNAPGGFVLAAGGSGTVTAYCGVTIIDGETSTGRINLIVVGTQMAGAVIVYTGELGLERLYHIQGTITGTAPNQTITVNQILGDQDPVDGLILIAEGTLDATAGTITNGTWELQLEGTTTDFGTWDGSTSCRMFTAN